MDKLVEIPQRIPALFGAAFLGEERDPQAPISVVGVSRIGGEVFAFDDFTTTEKISYFFQLLAGVNLFLFLFNLLPLCRWTAATSPARCTRRPGPRSPACAAGPTRARSTSPS